MRAPKAKGAIARSYYIKLEQLAILLHDYLSECQKHALKAATEALAIKDADIAAKDAALAEQRTALAAQNEALAHKNAALEGMRAQIKFTKPLVRDGYFYIAASPGMIKNMMFSMGETDNLRKRERGYNTKRAQPDEIYRFYYARRCNNAKAVENEVRAMFSSFKVDGHKDMFRIRFECLRDMAEAVIDGRDRVVHLRNQTVDAAATEEFYAPETLPEPIDIDALEPVAAAQSQALALTQHPAGGRTPRQRSARPKGFDSCTPEEIADRLNGILSRYCIKHHGQPEGFDFATDKSRLSHTWLEWKPLLKYITEEEMIVVAKVTPIRTVVKQIMTAAAIPMRWAIRSVGRGPEP